MRKKKKIVEMIYSIMLELRKTGRAVVDSEMEENEMAVDEGLFSRKMDSSIPVMDIYICEMHVMS